MTYWAGDVGRTYSLGYGGLCNLHVRWLDYGVAGGGFIDLDELHQHVVGGFASGTMVYYDNCALTTSAACGAFSAVVMAIDRLGSCLS